MQSECAGLEDIADYIAAMCDELAALSRPIGNSKLTSLLLIAADLARAHDIAVENEKPVPSEPIVVMEPPTTLWDQILPARHKSHARASLSPKRLSRALR